MIYFFFLFCVAFCYVVTFSCRKLKSHVQETYAILSGNAVLRTERQFVRC